MGFKHLKKRDYSSSPFIDWAQVKTMQGSTIDDETQELRKIIKQLKKIAKALEDGN